MNSFHGVIDEVSLYSRALSASEIKADYLAPVSWWRAEDNADDSVGDNDGTLYNGATFAAGKTGQAFSFPNPIPGPNSGAVDYVQAPTNGLPTGKADRTMSIWVKAD